LHASDIVGFVQRQASHLHQKRAKLLTTALRSFLQYARYRGKAKQDLAAAVPVVANWSMSSIPRAIAPEHVRRLLASIDRNTPIGRRDYAILLLLARLGLRSGEVAFLELEDIDWNAGRLNVRGKSGQRANCPCLRKLAKRSPHICGVDDRKVPAGVCSCAPKRRFVVFKGPVVLDRLFGTALSEPASTLLPAEHISFDME
jgi:site-specific recombinase XerC